MPLYVVELNVPKNTPKDTPVSKDILIKEKLISKIEVAFPPGPQWAVGVKIQYGIKQFWPEPEGEWIYGENEVISWDERFEMPNPNEVLTIYAHSEGTDFDHNVIVRIMTLPIGYQFLEKLVDNINKIWKAIIGS
jgi:hypothetical protein